MAFPQARQFDLTADFLIGELCRVGLVTCSVAALGVVGRFECGKVGGFIFSLARDKSAKSVMESCRSFIRLLISPRMMLPEVEILSQGPCIGGSGIGGSGIDGGGIMGCPILDLEPLDFLEPIESDEETFLEAESGKF